MPNISNEIAICIDCWTNLQPPEHLFVKQTIEFINNRSKIGTVILASYQIGSEHYHNSLWYSNYHTIFNNDLPVPELWTYHAFTAKTRYMPWHPWDTEQHTEPTLLNYKFDNQFQIAMRYWYELEYYLKLHPNIDTIWIFGCSLEYCCKDRYLGYKWLKKLSNLRILSNSNCICDPHTFNSEYGWKQIDDTIYEYLPN